MIWNRIGAFILNFIACSTCWWRMKSRCYNLFPSCFLEPNITSQFVENAFSVVNAIQQHFFSPLSLPIILRTTIKIFWNEDFKKKRAQWKYISATYLIENRWGVEIIIKTFTVSIKKEERMKILGKAEQTSVSIFFFYVFSRFFFDVLEKSEEASVAEWVIPIYFFFYGS